MPTGTVNAPNVNMFVAPDDAVLTPIPQGAQVDIKLDDGSGWLMTIAIVGGQKRLGFIESGFITPDQPPPPPVTDPLPVGGVPAWLATMRQIDGTHALDDNPVILGWAKKIGELFPDMASYCAGYTHDKIAWCGLTVGYCMAINGVRPVFGPTAFDKFLWANAWKPFGTADPAPQPGDVLTFDFGHGDQHVTLYEQTTGNRYTCHGGNQSSQVKLSNYPISQCTSIRRPPAAAH